MIRNVKYTIVLFFLLTVASTVATLSYGVPNLENRSLLQLSIYWYLPSTLISIAVFTIMAYRENRSAFINSIFATVGSWLLGTVILSLLKGEIYIEGSWVFDFPLSLLSSFTGVVFGLRLSARKALVT